MDLTGIETTDRILYTLCRQDGTAIYKGNDPRKLCRKINQEIEGRGVSVIKIEPRGLKTQKHDALRSTVYEGVRPLNPRVLVVLLSSPGARLSESSTEPKPVRRGKRLWWESVFRLEREGETGSLTFFNPVKERLKYFLTMLRSRMSSELKYTSVEGLIRKARDDFERTYPGPDITIEFKSEAGASHWVRIPPRQRLKELWMSS